MSCYCSDYETTKPLYSYDVNSGRMKVISTNEEPGLETTVLECTQCGTNWKFTRDDSYHYVIVEWVRVK